MLVVSLAYEYAHDERDRPFASSNNANEVSRHLFRQRSGAEHELLPWVIDLGALDQEARKKLASSGAEIWNELDMAIVRDPPRSVTGSPVPVQVNRDQWAVLHGLDRILAQARRHREKLGPDGNGALAVSTGYPALDADGRLTAGPTRPTQWGWGAALNLSIGTSSHGAFDPSHPISVGTRRASAVMPVVMAAGNAFGLRRGPLAFSKWAKAPWVMAVTALRDGALADDSACGTPDDPTSWPAYAAADDRLTIVNVADGSVEQHRGTSFAAPVVTRQIALLTCLALTVRASIRERHDAREGVPRVGCSYIDAGINPAELHPPGWPYGALPIAGLSAEAIEQLAQAAHDADFEPTPALLRRLLDASARPVEGHGRHQIGAGEISDGTTAVFLARLSAGAYLRAMLPHDQQREAVAPGLESVPLCNNLLPRILEVWRASLFGWFWDFRAAEQLFGLTFLDPGGNPV